MPNGRNWRAKYLQISTWEEWLTNDWKKWLTNDWEHLVKDVKIQQGLINSLINDVNLQKRLTWINFSIGIAILASIIASIILDKVL